MRIILLAAALSVSSIAVAQTTETTTTAAPTQPIGIPTTSGPPGDGITQQGTDPNGMGVAPPGTNEAPQAAPPGTTVVPAPDQAAAFTPKPATTEYPACSKTVTDG